MSIHRDDHDAALARIDALEEDLRRSVRAAEAAKRLADETKRELEALRKNQPAPKPEPALVLAKPLVVSEPVPPEPERRRTPVDPEDLARAKHGMNVGLGAILVGILAATCGGSWLGLGPQGTDLVTAITTLGAMIAVFGLVLVVTAVRPQR
ncbi:MAG: hypothetical protein QM831_04240 [Kofleriaceae bacterium]